MNRRGDFKQWEMFHSNEVVLVISATTTDLVPYQCNRAHCNRQHIHRQEVGVFLLLFAQLHSKKQKKG